MNEPRRMEVVDTTSGPCPSYKEPLGTFPGIVVPGNMVLVPVAVGTGGEATGYLIDVEIQKIGWYVPVRVQFFEFVACFFG